MSYEETHRRRAGRAQVQPESPPPIHFWHPSERQGLPVLPPDDDEDAHVNQAPAGADGRTLLPPQRQLPHPATLGLPYGSTGGGRVTALRYPFTEEDVLADQFSRPPSVHA